MMGLGEMTYAGVYGRSVDLLPDLLGGVRAFYADAKDEVMDTPLWEGDEYTQICKKRKIDVNALFSPI
jgi:hypothetical protein